MKKYIIISLVALFLVSCFVGNCTGCFSKEIDTTASAAIENFSGDISLSRAQAEAEEFKLEKDAKILEQDQIVLNDASIELKLSDEINAVFEGSGTVQTDNLIGEEHKSPFIRLIGPVFANLDAKTVPEGATVTIAYLKMQLSAGVSGTSVEFIPDVSGPNSLGVFVDAGEVNLAFCAEDTECSAPVKIEAGKQVIVANATQSDIPEAEDLTEPPEGSTLNILFGDVSLNGELVSGNGIELNIGDVIELSDGAQAAVQIMDGAIIELAGAGEYIIKGELKRAPLKAVVALASAGAIGNLMLSPDLDYDAPENILITYKNIEINCEPGSEISARIIAENEGTVSVLGEGYLVYSYTRKDSPDIPRTINAYLDDTMAPGEGYYDEDYQEFAAASIAFTLPDVEAGYLFPEDEEPTYDTIFAENIADVIEEEPIIDEEDIIEDIIEEDIEIEDDGEGDDAEIIDDAADVEDEGDDIIIEEPVAPEDSEADAIENEELPDDAVEIELEDEGSEEEVIQE